MPRWTDAEKIDLLRTMFAEQWDGASDFLEAINEILERDKTPKPQWSDREGNIDGRVTWEEAETAWESVHVLGTVPDPARVRSALTALVDPVSDPEDDSDSEDN
jgi:hypothetical protein